MRYNFISKRAFERQAQAVFAGAPQQVQAAFLQSLRSRIEHYFFDERMVDFSSELDDRRLHICRCFDIVFTIQIVGSMIEIVAPGRMNATVCNSLDMLADMMLDFLGK